MKVGNIFEEGLHGLGLFDKAKIDSIETFEKRGKPYLKCIVSGVDRPANPEEIVRQLFILRLMQDYGYPKDRMSIEKDIWFG